MHSALCIDGHVGLMDGDSAGSLYTSAPPPLPVPAPSAQPSAAPLPPTSISPAPTTKPFVPSKTPALSPTSQVSDSSFSSHAWGRQAGAPAPPAASTAAPSKPPSQAQTQSRLPVLASTQPKASTAAPQPQTQPQPQAQATQSPDREPLLIGTVSNLRDLFASKPPDDRTAHLPGKVPPSASAKPIPTPAPVPPSGTTPGSSAAPVRAAAPPSNPTAPSNRNTSIQSPGGGPGTPAKTPAVPAPPSIIVPVSRAAGASGGPSTAVNVSNSKSTTSTSTAAPSRPAAPQFEALDVPIPSELAGTDETVLSSAILSVLDESAISRNQKTDELFRSVKIDGSSLRIQVNPRYKGQISLDVKIVLEQLKEQVKATSTNTTGASDERMGSSDKEEDEDEEEAEEESEEELTLDSLPMPATLAGRRFIVDAEVITADGSATGLTHTNSSGTPLNKDDDEFVSRGPRRSATNPTLPVSGPATSRQPQQRDDKDDDEAYNTRTAKRPSAGPKKEEPISATSGKCTSSNSFEVAITYIGEGDQMYATSEWLNSLSPIAIEEDLYTFLAVRDDVQFLRLVGNADENPVIIQDKLSGKLKRRAKKLEIEEGELESRRALEKLLKERTADTIKLHIPVSEALAKKELQKDVQFCSALEAHVQKEANRLWTREQTQRTVFFQDQRDGSKPTYIRTKSKGFPNDPTIDAGGAFEAELCCGCSRADVKRIVDNLQSSLRALAVKHTPGISLT